MTTTTALRETTASDPLVVVSTWRCRTGRERELERIADRLAGRSAVVLHEAAADEYRIAHRFADRPALQRWLDGPERAALHEALEVVAERVGEPQRLSGLEPWFASVGKPPRWKMWLASFLGAYPLVVLFQWLAAPHVEGLPLLVRSAVLPLVLLSLMTYVMMPLVTRRLAGWLAPD
jgi:antibiotic biosynthesis monooxygenase (ABM) superfamily enzyme